MRIINTVEQNLAKDGPFTSHSLIKNDQTIISVPLITNDPSQVIDFCSRQTEETKKHLQQQLDQLSERFNISLRFIVSEELNSIIVKIVDPYTDKVIKEIPSAEIQKIKISIKEAIGVIFDVTV